MHLCLKSVVFITVWLSAYTLGRPNDVAEVKAGAGTALSEEPVNEEKLNITVDTGTVIDPDKTSDNEVKLNNTVVTDEKTEENCSHVQDANSPVYLRCPDVPAFYRHLRQGENKDVNVEIQYVGGDFSLPLDHASIQLESLIIRNASLTTLFTNSSDTQSLRSLKRLDLSGNPDFDVQSLVNLGELNDLTHLSMSGTAIETIDDQLSNLLSNLPQLEGLDLSSSGISYLDDTDFDTNKELKYLNIAGNNKLAVVTFPRDVIYRLIYLNVSNCILRSIKVQEDQARNSPLLGDCDPDAGRLEVLDVSGNKLREIPSLLLCALHNKCFLFNISKNSFGGASENCQTYHLSHFIQSKQMDASSCPGQPSSYIGVFGKEELQFKKKEALQKCNWNSCPPSCQCDSKEKIVDCRNKSLKSIPVVAPSQAEFLLLRDNNLENLEGIESPVWCNLRVLNVGFNNISQIIPSRKIQGNCRCASKETNVELKSSCFPQFLEKLHLNNNNLKNYTRNDCNLFYPLEELDLSGNKMETLAPVCGGPLNHIETLNLSRNKIKSISEEEISQFPRLESLLISDNITVTFDINMFPLGLSIHRIEEEPKTSHKNEVNTPHNNEPLPQEVPDMEATNNKDSNNDSSNDSSNEAEARNPESSNSSTSSPAPGNSTVETDRVTPEGNDGSNQSQVFMTLTAIIIVFFICMLTCYCNYWKNLTERIRDTFGTPPAPPARRKYDCFVVCSSRDFAQVRETVIVPLTQRGYSIAWHHNAFVPGEWIMQNVERAVQNSARMLVFATKNLISSRWGLHEIRRGRHEEFTNPDFFKIVALVTKSLPKKLHRDLYELVCLRSHIKLTDRDYIDQICLFLPPLEPVGTRSISAEGVYMTMNDISHLLERYEEIRQNERQTSAVHLAELFHTHRENDRVSIRVDIATVFANHVCDDRSTCPTCRDARNAMIERFKARAYSTCSLNSETNSLQEYVLDGDDGEDITDVLRGEETSGIRRRINSF